jgi:hypothetical protein
MLQDRLGSNRMYPQKHDWYQRIESHAIRIFVLILLIADLVRIIRGKLGL